MKNDRLKFRAYVEDFCFNDKDGNEYKKSFMVYEVTAYGGCSVGTYVEDLIEQLEEQGFTRGETERIRDHYYENDDWFIFNADFVEQSTGLHDENGKLIYEGDFVLLNGEKWQVIWVDEDCAFYFSNLKETYHQPIYPDFYTMTGDFKVIGNIHENPKLLEGVK